MDLFENVFNLVYHFIQNIVDLEMTFFFSFIALLIFIIYVIKRLSQN